MSNLPSDKLMEISVIQTASDRIRKIRAPAKLKEMAESIEQLGLIQPIVLDIRDDVPWIVAGETRLMIVRQLAAAGKPIKFLGRQLDLGLIPFVDAKDLSEDQLLEIELRENLDRADLTWQEVVDARRRLYEMRHRQGASLAETTAEAGLLNVNYMAQSVEIARRLDDPEIRGAKSFQEAQKIAAKKDESLFLAALARKVEQAPDASLLAVEAESLEYTRGMEPESIDLLITDPPYGISADNFGVGLGHVYDDSPAAYRKLMEDIMPELYRVLKPRAHAYVFCDIEHFVWLRDLARKSGFTPWRTAIIWAKNRGHVPISMLGPMRCHELILYVNKGERVVEIQGRPDVISVPIVEGKLHAAQKPVEVYNELISRSAQPGDMLFDPFCGSGTIFEAAHHSRMRAIGVDLDVTHATLRVQELLSRPRQGELIDLL